MAVLTMDDLVVALPGQVIPIYKSSATSKGAGTFHSLWQITGAPGAGGTPATGTGAACTSATPGALYYVNPTAPALSYLARVLVNTGTVGSLIFYDRLVHTSGLNGTLTTAQSINTTALPRYTTGATVLPWIEWYTATGSTQVNFSVSYTNDGGTPGQISPTQAFVATPVAGQMHPVLLNGKDGARSIETLTLSASTLTAGNFGITLMKRLLTVPMATTNTGVVMDAFAVGLQQIPDNSCLAMMVWCSTTSTGPIHGEISIAQG